MRARWSGESWSWTFRVERLLNQGAVPVLIPVQIDEKGSAMIRIRRSRITTPIPTRIFITYLRGNGPAV